MTSAETWIRERVGGQDLSWADLVSLITYAQEELGVVADGKPGARTLMRLDQHNGDDTPSKQLPVPKGRAATVALYGDPSWVKLDKGRAVDLDDRWERANIRWFTLHTGKRVRMHRLVGAEFVQLFKQACEASGYTPASVQTFNPRVIGRTSRLSMHAYGIAFDVDGIKPKGGQVGNPWGGVRADGTPSLLRENMAFVDVFEAAGWCWGGRWRKGKGDDMHFQRAFP